MGPSWSQLVAVPKTVASVRLRTKSHPGHRGIDVVLSCDPGYALTAAVRVNVRLLESFSAILRYEPPRSRPLVVLRVNGDHGEHAVPGEPPISGPHIHRASPEQEPLPLHDRFKPKHADPIDAKYRSLPFAWELFCRTVNIAPHERLARVVARLYNEIAQADIDELFNATDPG